ncbi:MAG: hypothetical protein JWN38_1251 [Candidatus Saccharibacteria bacterium]|nr:hypothetical protein [Candidatus Saccharibacteria bacterium]
MKTLITGWAGTGKTSICRELRERGYNAFDGDKIPGLAAWRDIQTHQPVAVDTTRAIDFQTVDWIWDPVVLEELLATDDDLYLCGSARDVLSFSKYFGRTIVLSLDPALQTHRILTRTNNNYGKHPDDLAVTLRGQAILEAEAQTIGAILIDASQPLTAIVDQVIYLPTPNAS